MTFWIVGGTLDYLEVVHLSGLSHPFSSFFWIRHRGGRSLSLIPTPLPACAALG